jgi:hypothetical protein
MYKSLENKKFQAATKNHFVAKKTKRRKDEV